MNTQHAARIAIASSLIAMAFVFVGTFVIASASTAHAAENYTTYTLLEPLPDLKGGLKTEISLNDYVQYAFNLLIALTAVIAVFMIVWGGLQYMTTDSWNGKSDGLKRTTNAIWGLIMVLCTYIILRTVNPALVAIPAALVPPLKSDINRQNPNAFFDELQSDADRYRVNSIAIGNAIKDAKESVDDLQSQYDELQSEINASTNLDEIDQLMLAQQFINDQIQKAKADVIVKEGELTMNGILSTNTNSQTTIAQINKSIQDVADMQSKYSNKVGDLGQYDAQNPIMQQALYTEAMLNLEKVNRALNDASITWFGRGSDVKIQKLDGTGKEEIPIGDAQSNLNYVINQAKSAIDKISDPTLKQQLTDRVNSSKTSVNNLSKK